MSNGGVPNRISAFCFKCHTQREVGNAVRVTLRNGKSATQGICLICGTNVSRISK